MWKKLAQFVLRFRATFLLVFVLLTLLMAYFAAQVKLSYDFAKAIPTDHPKYLDYQQFKQRFGDDGNLIVVGVRDAEFFTVEHFNHYRKLQESLRKVACVEDVLAVPGTVELQRDSTGERLESAKIFSNPIADQAMLDSQSIRFKQVIFYRELLYNPDTDAYLIAVRVNKDSMNSPARVHIVDDVQKVVSVYQKNLPKVETHISGLPLIRTILAGRIQQEMKWFLIASLGLSILILLLFFRSLTTTLLSMTVVITGVVWSVALIHLMGYKITLLTALLPSLVVVIGIPNCIYFINKYHSGYLLRRDLEEKERKYLSLVDMVSKMGVVTLFCNITAAIGLGVFALTKSAVLSEFGMVAGISILLIFVVSFVLLPAVLSYLPAPKSRELKYLDARWIARWLTAIEQWVFQHTKKVMLVTGLVLLVSFLGIMRLKSVAFLVDDLPKKDPVYQDMKFFETHFKGIMPLEIVIDAKKKRGLRGLKPYRLIDSLSAFLHQQPEMNRPLSITEGLKMATQAFNDQDTNAYRMPGDFEAVFMMDLLNQRGSGGGNGLNKMMRSFIDSNKQYTRVSVSMKDVGTERLPELLQKIEQEVVRLFDTSYHVTLTGTSITFLEGSKFIINGLKESIFWAFLLIALCMLYLFRSMRILLCSLVPNLIPLVITAGIMGWTGVPLKPSTVLVFSVALGIAVDITIRFLVNYRQVLPEHQGNVFDAVRSTVQQTGLSIIYTSLVLMVGFIIFCASRFGGTFALGWLTSVTLFTATLTNLIVLPILLNYLAPKTQKS
jgi:predicted RND superfamily exporter protein